MGHFVWEMRPEFDAALRAFEPTAFIFRRSRAKRPATMDDGSVPQDVVAAIEHDLTTAALEGEAVRGWRAIRTRAAWVAEAFIRSREAQGALVCDDCGFDASGKAGAIGVAARSLLDVHHVDPLAEGRRLTTINDFRLLCPTCHRIVHATLGAAHRAAS